MNKIVEKDLGFNSIIGNLKILGSTAVEVGFFDDGTMSADGELPMAELAIMQNFGIPNEIPERNFIDKTAVDHENELHSDQQQIVNDIVDGKQDGKNGAIKVGEYYADAMKQTIEDFSTPENAPLTQALKGFNNPLVEDGKMKESVSVRLEEM